MKRGTPEHPKVRRLAELLNIPVYSAIGILEMLWHFTATYAPRGDIGRYQDKAIAEAVGWERPTGAKGVTPECKLSAALVEAGWLDSDPVFRLVVHDWHIHADQYVARKLARRGETFVTSLPVPVPIHHMPVPEPVPQPPAAATPDLPPPREPQPIRAPDREPPGYALDELWAEFRAAAAWTGWIEGDFREAWPEWCALDFSQRCSAVAGIRDQAGWREARFVTGARKWLTKREWQRRAPPAANEAPDEYRTVPKGMVWDPASEEFVPRQVSR